MASLPWGAELPDQLSVAPQRIGGAVLEARPIVVALARLQHEQAAGRAVQVPRTAVGEVVAERHGVELLRDPHVADLRVEGSC